MQRPIDDSVAVSRVKLFGIKKGVKLKSPRATLDPITLISVIVLMVFTGLAASYIPTRRAVHVEPMVALRTE